MSYSWTEEHLSCLGRIFLRKVLDNMRGYDESTVKFGTTGKGIQPNYQITYPNGIVRTIRGSSHGNYTDTEQFDSTKTSEVFSFAQVSKAYNNS